MAGIFQSIYDWLLRLFWYDFFFRPSAAMHGGLGCLARRLLLPRYAPCVHSRLFAPVSSH